MAGKEKNFENKVKRQLESMGAWYIKYWGGAKYTKSGVPDLLVNFNGYFLAIELKAPTGKPSHLQLYNIRKIRESHGLGIILYPKDYDLFLKLCDALSHNMWGVAETYQFEIDDNLKLSEEERGVLYGKPI